MDFRASRTLHKEDALGPMVVLGGGAVSYERSTPVANRNLDLIKSFRALIHLGPQPMGEGQKNRFDCFASRLGWSRGDHASQSLTPTAVERIQQKKTCKARF